MRSLRISSRVNISGQSGLALGSDDAVDHGRMLRTLKRSTKFLGLFVDMSGSSRLRTDILCR